MDVKEQAAPPRRVRTGREERSGGTSEMLAVGPAGADHGERYVLQGRPGPLDGGGPRAASGGVASGGLSVSSSGGSRSLVVLAIALIPAYLWGSSRYFFGFEGGEVVAYQGLPYAPLGFELNREWRRPGVTESEIKDPYKQPIENHKLYTKDQAEKVLGTSGARMLAP